MENDVLLNKSQIIEHCIQRINEVYEGDPENLKDFTKQDSIILNIQRACEACIDLAMHVVSDKRLGLPQSTRDAFDSLEQNKIIDSEMASRLKTMVGFRNIAVHEYQKLNLVIVQRIIEMHLNDLLEFAHFILKLSW
ncbi:MAG: DUF86 domain-containing protein [Bacillota bacterium]|nr:DUF86 domain-containing protein [Bacillota bacterium]MDD3298810.1 DUF86 domain-containing protein [Bacillota bacterium]MDD3850720.1 DUF86 domain-containing protein [Bacillota bacterium]MDD4707958.1 DUF86 domain-containing protein [Bacillota bacterium]